MKLLNLDEIFLDALREMGNIGAGNATTALATLLDQTVDMSVPRVGVMSICEFTQMLGGPESLAAVVYLAVTGDAPGHVAFILQNHNACRLADAVFGHPAGTTSAIGEMEGSALMEVGNILTGAYLVAIGEMTHLDLMPTPPALAMDMTGAILSSILMALETVEDEALTIISQLGGPEQIINGYLIYLPEPSSIEIIMRALQLEV